MASIVLGVGTSHSPLLALDGSEWEQRAADDFRSKSLNLSDGRYVSYGELSTITQDRYADVATSEQFIAKSARAQAALDRLADEIEACDPDVAIIVGDDQAELYSPDNMPAIALYYGDEIVTHVHELMRKTKPPVWTEKVMRGWAVDAVHRFPGKRDLALELIAQLLEREVDIGACGRVDDPKVAGFGHAYGFVIERLFRKTIPVIPVLLNTYYPPNVILPRRCMAIGKALREAVEASPQDLRVAVIASGGLSHFVVDEALDRHVLDCLISGNLKSLENLPRRALNAGSSEILNWLLAGSAISHLPCVWNEYIPVQRTPAGTGIGMAFAVWSV